MKSILAVCLIAAALAFTMDEKMLVGAPTNLGFNDYTGPGFTAGMASDLKNFAESASSFYKDDIKANEVYILEQMNKKYGSDNRNFFIHIQTEPDVPFSWLCWVTTDNVIATRRAGINKVQPNWSYMVLKFIAGPYSDDYTHIQPGKAGDGIDQDTKDTINDLVNQFESGDSCSCNNGEVSSVAYGMINGLGRAYSTICDASGVTYSLVNTVDDLWISVKPKNCYYTFYVSQ